MKKHLWVGALAALSVTMGAGIAGASSHREAPAISNDPAADNTDVYAFVTGDKLDIVCSWIPFEEPSGGPNYYKFSDEVLYEIHVARGPTSLDDAITYQIRFKTAPITFIDPSTPKDPPPAGGQEFFAQLTEYFSQTYSVTKISGGTATEIIKDAKVAPPNIGPQTSGVVYPVSFGGPGTYNAAFMQSFITDGAGEGKSWAGQSDDAFFVDIGAIFDLANLRPLAGAAGRDNLAHYNVHTIALEIPMTKLTASGAAPAGDADILGIWASSSRRKVRVLRANGQTQGLGPWVQVSRLGLPLVNEAIIGIQDKDHYNRTKPKDDFTNFGAYFLNPIVVRDADFLGLYGTGKPLAAAAPAPKSGRTDIVDVINLKAAGAAITSVGDVLRVKMDLPTGFPNGRALATDVTGVLLSLLLTKNPAAGVDDGVTKNDTDYQTVFPYVALPWEGFSNGHSIP